MKHRKLLIVGMILLLFIPGIYFFSGEVHDHSLVDSSLPSNVLQVEKKMSYPLDHYFEVFEDKTKQVTIQEMIRGEYADRFQPMKEVRHSYGYTVAAYWVKIRFYNISDRQDWLLEVGNAALNNIDLYLDTGDGIFLKKTAGDQYPFPDREVLHKNFVFHLPLNSHENQTVYLRIEAGGIMFFPMTLWSPEGFARYNYQNQFIWGLYYGSISVMLIYHLFLFFMTKNKNYLYYFAAIFFIMLFQLTDSGFAFQVFWPNFPAWNEQAPSVIASLTLLTLILLSQRVLKSNDHAPLVHRFFNILIRLTIGAFLFSFFLPYSKSIVFLQGLFLLSVVPTLFLMVISFKKRYYPARYFALAVSFLFLGIFISLGKNVIFPSNFFTENSIKIGSVLFVVFLSFSVGAYINTIQKESEQEKRQRKLLTSLHQYTKSLTATLDLGEIYRQILKSMLTVTGHEHGFILIEGEGYYRAVSANEALNLDRMNQRLQSISKKELSLLQTGSDRHKPVLMKNYSMEVFGIEQTANSLIIIPIVYQRNTLATVILFSQNPLTCHREVLDIIFDFSVQAGITIENAILFNKTKRMATFDGLTNLYNRKHFFDVAKKEFERAKRYQSPLSVMMIDIDFFKDINDTYGHIIGDQVLRRIAQRLKETLRASDLIGRYGGEEFIILLPETDVENTYKLAERLRSIVEQEEITIPNHTPLSVTISIGISTLQGEQKSLYDLIDQADKALYKVKNNGRNSIETM